MTDIPAAIWFLTVVATLALALKIAAVVWARPLYRELRELLDQLEAEGISAEERRVVSRLLQSFDNPVHAALLGPLLLAVALFLPVLAVASWREKPLRGSERVSKALNFDRLRAEAYEADWGSDPRGVGFWHDPRRDRILRLALLSTVFGYPVLSAVLIIASLPLLIIGLVLAICITAFRPDQLRGIWEFVGSAMSALLAGASAR